MGCSAAEHSPNATTHEALRWRLNTVVGGRVSAEFVCAQRSGTPRCRGGGGWHVAFVYCSRLQRAAPIGRSPFAALPLDPFPLHAVVPIGLSPPCALPSSLAYLSLSTSVSFSLAFPSGGGGLRVCPPASVHWRQQAGLPGGKHPPHRQRSGSNSTPLFVEDSLKFENTSRTPRLAAESTGAVHTVKLLRCP